MLVDLHVVPGREGPEALAQAVADAGLDGAAVTSAGPLDLDAYRAAFAAQDLEFFAGVELRLDKGSLVFIPEDPAALAGLYPKGSLALGDALALVGDTPGALLGGHPYCRDLESVLGDRVYKISTLTGLETRVGHGRLNWDRLADHAAGRAHCARLGSCGGKMEWLGSAATVVAGPVSNQAELVEALRSGATLPVELDDPAAPRDRRPPEPAPRPQMRREGGRDGGRGGRDGGRGGRDGGRGGRDGGRGGRDGGRGGRDGGRGGRDGGRGRGPRRER